MAKAKVAQTIDYSKAKAAMEKANKLVAKAADLDYKNQAAAAKKISANKSAHEVAW
jgi:hypothetical protein